jgi:hypothetical protein
LLVALYSDLVRWSYTLLDFPRRKSLQAQSSSRGVAPSLQLRPQDLVLASYSQASPPWEIRVSLLLMRLAMERHWAVWAA